MVKLLSERLGKESERLQSLMGDLMDLSRIEDRERASAAGAGCDFGSVVMTSVEAHRAKAEGEGIELTLHDRLPVGARATISATDATLVCDNLISNALAYTEEGSVRVTLAQEGYFAVLEVEDTGIGIAYADQERVFERFYRVDTARSRESGGTGLGLSLVRHAVSRAGGTIKLASEPEKGSIFTVRLPLE